MNRFLQHICKAHIITRAGFHDLAIFAKYASKCDMSHVAGDSHALGGGKDLLEMKRLWCPYDIPDGIGFPVVDAIVDRGQIGRGIKKTAVALTNNGRFSVEGGNFGKENTKGTLTDGGDSSMLQVLAERGKGIIISAFPKSLIEFDIQKVVKFLKFAPRKFDRLLPNGEVFKVACLEFYQFFAGCAFDILIGFFDAIDLTVKSDEFGDSIDGEGLAIEEMLPSINDFAKLGSPVANVIVGDDFVAEKSGDTHEAVAENGAADMPDVHGFCHIGGTKIHHDFAGGGHLGHSQADVGSQFMEGTG